MKKRKHEKGRKEKREQREEDGKGRRTRRGGVEKEREEAKERNGERKENNDVWPSLAHLYQLCENGSALGLWDYFPFLVGQ